MGTHGESPSSERDNRAVKAENIDDNEIGTGCQLSKFIPMS